MLVPPRQAPSRLDVQLWCGSAELEAALVSGGVRLRGARAHDCRLCRSLRSVRAVRAGGDEALFDAIDDEHHVLPGPHRVAVRAVDAVVWQPGAWPSGLAATVRRDFGDAGGVELVLDIVRNAANKIAVSLGADDPHVTDGIEYFDVDSAGDLVYGLPAPG